MSRNTLAKAISVIESRKRNAEFKAYRNIETLQQDPEWVAVDKQVRMCNINIAKDKLQGNDPTENKRQLARLLLKRNAVLKSHGMSQKDLLPQYSCQKCNDTGFVNGEKCSCLRREVTHLLLNDCGYFDRNCTFENSTETNADNKKVYNACLTFCQKMQETRLRIILLMGKTGTGKTYLANAIANKAIENQQSAFVITAYSLSELFLKGHLSNQQDKLAMLEDLMDVDLLVIDDLGVENTFTNVTNEYLFALINERIQRGNKTVISTNLTIAQIQQRYDDRIFSRIADKKLSMVLHLDGEDKRLTTK